jgi:hypothetical protein
MPVNSLSNRAKLSLKEDLMRSPVAEALAGSMIQYFHGGCKRFRGDCRIAVECGVKHQSSTISATPDISLSIRRVMDEGTDSIFRDSSSIALVLTTSSVGILG